MYIAGKWFSVYLSIVACLICSSISVAVPNNTYDNWQRNIALQEIHSIIFDKLKAETKDKKNILSSIEIYYKYTSHEAIENYNNEQGAIGALFQQPVTVAYQTVVAQLESQLMGKVERDLIMQNILSAIKINAASHGILVMDVNLSM